MREVDAVRALSAVPLVCLFASACFPLPWEAGQRDATYTDNPSQLDSDGNGHGDACDGG